MEIKTTIFKKNNANTNKQIKNKRDWKCIDRIDRGNESNRNATKHHGNTLSFLKH